MRWNMLTKNQNRSLSFFLSRALFLGGGVSNIFALTGNDAWISALLGLFLGIIIIMIINYFSKKINGNLNQFLSQNCFSSYLLKFLFFSFYTLILFIGILSLSTLVSSYYLTHTPSILICAPIILLLIYITNKGLKCVGRVGQILFPICLIVTIGKVFLLMETANLNFFLPIYTAPVLNIMLGALIFAVLSACPFLLLIEEEVTLKQNILNYLIGTLSGLLVIVNITSVLGDALVRMFSFPEYAILRKIEFFRFFENVENIIAFIWLADLFIIMATTMNRLKDLFKNNNKIPYLYLIIIALLITLYIENHFECIMFIYNTFIYGFIFLLLLIFIFLFFKTLKREKKQ